MDVKSQSNTKKCKEYYILCHLSLCSPFLSQRQLKILFYKAFGIYLSQSKESKNSNQILFSNSLISKINVA